MDAPIDIIIRLIKGHLKGAKEEAYYMVGPERTYLSGKMDAYQELINEFEGYKKLFN